MKQLIPVTIAATVLLISCSKMKEEAPLLKAMILEEKTNVPLAARIDFYHCKSYDNFMGGCMNEENIYTGYSDANGNFTYNGKETRNADRAIVSKSKYWDGYLAENTYLVPEAWINLHIKTKNNYAGTGYFVIQVAGETNPGSLLYFKAPADSIINLRIYGNQVNNLNWFVTSTDLTICYFYCPIDTIKSGILNKTVAKWETSSMDLDY